MLILEKMLPKHFKLLLSVFLVSSLIPSIAQAKDISSDVIYRPSKLQPVNVAVVYNIDDANSTKVAQYYLKARQIPERNSIGVRAPKHKSGVMSPEDFGLLKENIEHQLNDEIQVIVLIWTTPFAVNCNSITSALTLGYDAKQCEHSCNPGKKSPYFNSASLYPFQSDRIRISILIPTNSVSGAEALIDRGVLSSFSNHEGTGYFLKTSDVYRSKPREPFYPNDLNTIHSRRLFLRTLSAEAIQSKKDVMFYFTGQSAVDYLDSLNFLPGAIADHLTSFGGVLTDENGQMPSTKWIEAGATGSYGTVSEPCNYWQKFPNPQVLLGHYLAGETLVESYWKSVAWPAQGLFIGEPLAAPYHQLNFGQMIPLHIE